MAAELTAAGRRKRSRRQRWPAPRAGSRRFYLAHQAAPPEALRQFMDAACGVYVTSVSFSWFTLQGQASDERMLEHGRAGIRPNLIDQIPADARHVGLWFGRQAGRVIAIAAFESIPVTFLPLSPIPDAQGNVRIEDGWRRRPRASTATSTRAASASRCQLDLPVVAPAFPDPARWRPVTRPPGCSWSTPPLTACSRCRWRRCWPGGTPARPVMSRPPMRRRTRSRTPSPSPPRWWPS